jgi:hypothetical protein
MGLNTRKKDYAPALYIGVAGGRNVGPIYKQMFSNLTRKFPHTRGGRISYRTRQSPQYNIRQDPSVPIKRVYDHVARNYAQGGVDRETIQEFHTESSRQ